MKEREFNDLCPTLQQRIKPEHYRGMEKRLHLPFLHESWLRNCQERPHRTRNWGNLSEETKWFSDKPIHMQILTIHRILEGVRAKHLEVTLIYRFLHDIRLHTQREDGANTSCLWFSPKNCRSQNDALSSSSSSCRAASADILDPLSPFLPIMHRLRQVFRVTSCVLT